MFVKFAFHVYRFSRIPRKLRRKYTRDIQEFYCSQQFAFSMLVATRMCTAIVLNFSNPEIWGLCLLNNTEQMIKR